MAQAVSSQRGRCVRTQVARLRPEVLEVGGIRRTHAAVEDGEGVHAHGAPSEPRARGEAHARDLTQGVAFLFREAFGGVAAPARFDGIDDPLEPVAQDPLRVHADGEHVRNRHGRTDDIGHDAVPDAGGVLDRPDGAEATAAPAVGVPEGSVRAVHLCRHDPGVPGGGGVGPIGGDGRVVGAVPAEDPPTVGLEEVGAAVDREPDLVLLAGGLVLGQVLAVGHRCDVLEEATLVRPLGRQVDGEPRLGIPESPVHVAVRHRCLTPLVDVDVGRAEGRVGALEGGVVAPTGSASGSHR